MKTIKILIISMAMFTLASGCNKEPLEAASGDWLVAESPIKVFTQGTINAEIEGENLSYEWSVTPTGDLHVSGSSVKFSSCCANTYLITCTATDGSINESASIEVVVEEE